MKKPTKPHAVKKSDARAQAHLAETFNRAYAIGTRVRYLPGDGAWRESTTSAAAVLLDGHTACVRLAGVNGLVPLVQVEVIGEEP